MNQKVQLANRYICEGDKKQAMALCREVLSSLDLDDDDDVHTLEELNNLVFMNKMAEEYLPILKEYVEDFSNYALDYIKSNGTEYTALEQLVNYGADIYKLTRQGENILHLICKSHARDIVKLGIKLAENYDISEFMCADNFGATPLHYCVNNKKTELLKVLLEKGINADIEGSAPMGGSSHRIDFNSMTSLWLACREGNIEAAELLINSGADILKKDQHGQNACFYAAWQPNKRIYSDYFGSMQNEDRIQEKKRGIIKLLGSTVNSVDDNGQNPLLYLLSENQFNFNSYIDEMGVLLVEQGIDINHADNSGCTALIYAAQVYKGSLLKALVTSGADLNAKDKEGNTPLLYAVCNHYIDTARYFLKKGAEFESVNNSGKSAMDIAAEKGLNEVIELMI